MLSETFRSTIPGPQSYPAGANALGSTYGDDVRLVSFQAADGQLFDNWTVSVGGSITSIDYTPPGGTLTTYTVSGVSSAATLAAALANGETALGAAILDTYYVNAATAALTARRPGVNGTLTNTTNASWTHATTGAAGSDLPVGRLVLRQSAGAGPSNVIQGRLPTASSTYKPTSKQSFALTGASLTTGDIITTEVRMTSTAKSAVASTKYDGSSNNTTVTAHAAALDTACNTAFGAGSGVVVTDASGVMTITSDVQGESFEVSYHVSAGATGTWTNSASTGFEGSPTTDYKANILGICTNHRCNLDSSGVLVVPARQGGVAMSRGRIRVAVGDAGSVVAGDRPWIKISDGTFHAAVASGLVRAPDNFRWAESGTSVSYAILEVL